LLLALFLIDLSAGLLLFLPLVGRRNAGVKFYRLVLIVSGSLALLAALAHWLGRRPDVAIADLIVVALTLLVYLVLRYPKRLIYRASVALLGAASLIAGVLAFEVAVRPPHLAWSVAGALVSMALLGSVNLAMMLGHWYLVVRGMAIDPLKRLTFATLYASLARTVLICVSLGYLASTGHAYGSLFHQLVVGQGIFFWMRIGWGVIGPLLLYPMVWGTVRIRSTMAATGILYVEVVAVVIGEVLGAWLATLAHLPL
jgi:hypothetical protein